MALCGLGSCESSATSGAMYLEMSDAGSDDHVADTSRSAVGWAIQILAAVTSWWVSAIIVILTMKNTVGHAGVYPYAMAFTAFTQPTIGVMAWVVFRLTNRSQAALPPLRRGELGMLLLIGLLWGGEISLTNKALSFLPVATRTMLNATNVLFMMVSAQAWGLERLDCLRLCSAGILLTGGILQGLAKDDKTQASGERTIGFAIQMASIACATQRWAFIQMVLHHSPVDSALGNMTKMQLLARVIPITGVVAFLFSLCWESHAFDISNLMQLPLLWNVLQVSAACTVMQYAEWKLVHMLSFVAFNVIATVHQIPIVLAGVVWQHDTISMHSAVGFMTCIIGAIVYTVARSRDAK